jgi:cysteine desulfurase / selenocysteine lyase
MNSHDPQTASLAEQFPVIDRHAWLNHAAIAPWPQPVIRAMRAFVQDNQCHGPLAYNQWMQTEARLRHRAAGLFGSSQADDIALLANTSMGLNQIALGLDWRPGDSVVFPANDFPSNRLPWQNLARLGVEPRAVTLDPLDPEASLIAAMGPGTRLLAISSVQYDTGLHFNLERLGEACARRGALYCLDVIQQLGALPLDVTAIGADFAIAGSHKWLLAPEGLALFWSRPEARRQLATAVPGWRMFPDPFNFSRDDWSAGPSAQRFEPGTLNMAGIHALDASVELLMHHGMATIGEGIRDRTQMLTECLSKLPGLHLASPTRRERMAGIVSFGLEQESAGAIVSRLAASDVHAAVRGSLVRLSPHFYTPFEQIEQAVRVIRDAI